MKKRFLSFILSLCIAFSVLVMPNTVSAATVSFPTDNLTVSTGTVYPTFSITESAMVYNYVVKNSSGTTIASKEFEYQSYTSSSYGSFIIPTAGKYTITWAVGGYSLVVVSGTYHKKPNYSNYHTYTQSFTATGADVGPSAIGGTYTYDGTGKTTEVVNLPSGAKIQSYSSGNRYSYSPLYFTDAGVYDITIAYTVPGEYFERSLWARITILPKEVSISNIEVEDKVYDGTYKAVVRCGGLSGIIEGDDVSLPDVVYGEFLSANAGEILVTLNEEILVGEDRKNYDFFEALTATITPAPLKIKANNLRMEKGDAIPQLTYEIVEGQLYGSDQLTGTLSVDADANLAGNYEITQGTLSAGGNYDITFIPGTLSVKERGKQDVIVQSVGAKTYGDEPFSINVTDNNAEFGAFTYTSANTNVATIDETGRVTVKNAGTTEITVSRAGNDDYADLSNKQTLTVNKADIAVTADSKTKRVGATDPILTYTYTGTLVGSDAFTGSLVRKPGEEIGQYDILIGTLAINDNYNITYNKATFEIVDKIPQNITVSEITEKTYGDDPFVVTATPDAASRLSDFTFESSNTNVAEIAADGTVTVKNAGETNITVKQAGNSDYAAFEKTQKLIVKKVDITITADAKTKRIGSTDPELTYQVTGELVNGDSITGNLTRKAGERIGKYDILIGTLAINDNYNITYKKATFEIVDKTPQTIVISDFPTKTYGDDGFTIEVTPDATSALNTFTYTSADETVATVDENGVVTIVGAGKVELTVSQAGNEEYAAAIAKKEFVVDQKAVTVDSIDLATKTAVLSGLVAGDVSATTLDFTKISIEPVSNSAELTMIAGAGYKADAAVAKAAIDELTLAMGRESVDTPNVDIETMYVGLDNLDPEKLYDVKLFMGNDEITFKTSDNKVTGKTESTVYWTFNQANPESTTVAISDGTYTAKVYEVSEGNYTEIEAIDIIVSGDTDVAAALLVKVTNFVLAGDKSANYSVTTEEIETEVSADMIVTVSAAAENGTVMGCGTYLKDSEVTLVATPNSGYRFSGWYNGDTAVSTKTTYTFTAATDTALVAKFTRRSSGGGGGGVSTYSIVIEKSDNGVVTSDRTSASYGTTVTLSVVPADGYTLEKLTATNGSGAAIELTDKGDGKYTFKMPRSQVAVKATFAASCPGALFRDVDVELWYHMALDYVITNGLMAGYGDGRFGPDDALDRAMVVQVLYNHEKTPGISVNDIFSDVKAGQWYTDAIHWAAQKGIVAGYGDGNFGPQDRVTIEQVAVILWNYAGNPTIGSADLAGVGNHSNWAVNALTWAVSAGIFEGMPMTDANVTATRAQTAQMLMNFLSK